MDNLKEKILKIIKKPSLSSLATVDENGRPWVRYVITIGADDMTIRCSTFIQARKVAHIKENPEVHVATGVDDINTQSGYLQIQGKATVSTDKTERHALWNDSMKEYFKGPDDPNFAIVVIKPYRIEYWGESMQPEVWQA